MSVRNLDFLFRPRSVAVIGASNRPGSVGATVFRNLLSGGFDGPIMPVNPKRTAIAGVLAYPDVSALPEAPDLAVICTPAATVPGLIAELGGRGTRAAVVLTAGLRENSTADGRSLSQAMLEAAAPYLLRIAGPNCVGLLVPGLGLNASFAHRNAEPGRLAFATQSGALATAVLDWAAGRNIGFSHFISMGDAADVDFGDVLDYLADDPDTGAILLYIEAITSARKFMSAARAAARNKPVIAIKAGRMPAGAAAAASHTGALAGADEVYDAALRRAGMLRVDSIEDLFLAAETLARVRGPAGDRLTIITNGGGAGVMSADALTALGGELGSLSDDTVGRLDAVLPANWSRGNPIDIIGDASGERYRQALEIVLGDGTRDSILLLHAPTAIVSNRDIAEDLVPLIAQARRPVLTNWLGGASVAEGRRVFANAGVPTFETPEAAVSAHMQLLHFRRNQAALMQAPPSQPEQFEPDRPAARAVIDAALAEGRTLLSEPEAKAVLAAYAVPTVATRVARDVDEAAALARDIGYPVALKILSPEISHKSDVGGVQLDLGDEAALRVAATAMTERCAALRPGARLEGFTVQAMARRPDAFELIIGAKLDPVFGPVLLFGEGGTAVEVVADRAVALPPLNMALAGQMIEETRISRLLAGYRNRPPVDRDAIALTLIKVAELVTDLAEVVELDINPLLSDADGVLALDARIGIVATQQKGGDRLAIRHYPVELEEHITLDGQDVLLRPIRPEDEAQHLAFIRGVEPEDIRFRFFGAVREFAHSQLARLTQIDYDREMALVAVRGDGEAEQTLGVVRVVADPDNDTAEFAILVNSALKGHGLGGILLDRIVAYCRDRGTRRLVAHVMRENAPMIGLARGRGFKSVATADHGVLEFSLLLNATAAEGGAAD